MANDCVNGSVRPVAPALKYIRDFEIAQVEQIKPARPGQVAGDMQVKGVHGDSFVIHTNKTADYIDTKGVKKALTDSSSLQMLRIRLGTFGTCLDPEVSSDQVGMRIAAGKLAGKAALEAERDGQ
jgi:hypothetical protein